LTSPKSSSCSPNPAWNQPFAERTDSKTLSPRRKWTTPEWEDAPVNIDTVEHCRLTIVCYYLLVILSNFGIYINRFRAEELIKSIELLNEISAEKANRQQTET
jgi:hypothetical protein